MTAAQMIALLQGIDSATEVKFKAIGAIPADSIVLISTTAHIQKGELDRSVAAEGGDTQTEAPLVVLQQG